EKFLVSRQDTWWACVEDKELLQHVPTCATKSGRRPWRQAAPQSLVKAAVDKTTRRGRTRVQREACRAGP
ncbi:hypothetical protein NQZ68_007073, partial [Dissostichus eleginoides]